VGGTGFNPQAGIPDFRVGNQVVTRNVAGGRGFRGTVGYFAEADFRGALGSDEIFQFRAETAFSSPAFLAAGRTAERLRYGAYLGAVEYQRDAEHLSVISSLGRLQPSPYQTISSRVAADQFSLSGGTDLTASTLAAPEMLGVVRDPSGETRVATSSALRGLQRTPPDLSPQMAGLTAYDLARVIADMQAGLPLRRMGEPYPAGLAGPPVPAATTAAPGAQPAPGGPAAPAPSDPYGRIVDRLVDRYVARAEAGAARSMLAEQLSGRMEELRRGLEEFSPPQQPATDDTAPGGPGESGRLSLRELGPLLRHGAELRHLSGGDPTRFDELMTAAEESLGAGEYFRAERRFARALRFTPGHPLATAGLAHAQIGAGLYVTAALGLRRLLIDRPEMIGVRYAQPLLPNRVRMNLAVTTLRSRIRAEERDRAHYAFLLAYVGRHMDEPAITEEGLRLLEESSPQDPLPAVLRAVWLEQDDAPE
jgi:hypothetical protein